MMAMNLRFVFRHGTHARMPRRVFLAFTGYSRCTLKNNTLYHVEFKVVEEASEIVDGPGVRMIFPALRGKVCCAKFP